MIEQDDQGDIVGRNLANVRERIDQAAKTAGRDPGSIRLIAVGKAQPHQRILDALDAGHRVFGENYVQESQGRWPGLRERCPGLEIHMIGPLQTNKSAQAVQLFDVIQTVDRPKLARSLAREMDQQDRRPAILIQVNTGEEPQKSGVLPDELDQLVRLCRDELQLDLQGLMAIPPAHEDCALHAALLVRLARDNGLCEISIGMSNDYEAAIRFGATMVRVGTGIFGARQKRT